MKNELVVAKGTLQRHLVDQQLRRDARVGHESGDPPVDGNAHLLVRLEREPLGCSILARYDDARATDGND